MLCGEVSAVGAVLLDQYMNVLAGLCPYAHPIIDSLTLENGASIYFFAHRVIIAEFFEDSTVTWVALINGAQTIERAIFAAQSLHSNSYRHYSFSPSELENGRGDDSSAKQSTRVVFAEIYGDDYPRNFLYLALLRRRLADNRQHLLIKLAFLHSSHESRVNVGPCQIDFAMPKGESGDRPH